MGQSNGHASNGARDALVETLGRYGLAATLAVLEDGEDTELSADSVPMHVERLGVILSDAVLDTLAADLSTLERDAGESLAVLLVRAGFATLHPIAGGFVLALADAGADALAEALDPNHRHR